MHPLWTDYVGSIAALVGTLGIGAAFLQLRMMREAAHAQMIDTFSRHIRRWDEPPVADGRTRTRLSQADLARKVQDAWERADDDLQLLMVVPNYFEDLGWMVRLGRVPIELVDATLGLVVLREWDRWASTVYLLRAAAEPTVYKEFELLAATVRALREKHLV